MQQANRHATDKPITTSAMENIKDAGDGNENIGFMPENAWRVLSYNLAIVAEATIDAQSHVAGFDVVS